MSSKFSWLKALKISLDASVYQDLGFSQDEAFSFAIMDNDRAASRPSRRLSDEEIKTRIRIEESRKGYDEAMATLAECQRKLHEGGPLVREGAEKARQEALRFREEARKKTR